MVSQGRTGLKDNTWQDPLVYRDGTRLHVQGLTKFFDCPTYSDITIVLPNGCKRSCHRLLLAACSPRLAGILAGDVTCRQMPMAGADSEALDRIIKFMYTGDCDLSPGQVVPTYDAAIKLEMTCLVMACKQYIRQSASVPLVAGMLNQAAASQQDVVLKDVLGATDASYHDVVADTSFRLLSEQAFTAFLKHHHQRMLPLQQLLDAANSWCSSDPVRLATAQRLLSIYLEASCQNGAAAQLESPPTPVVHHSRPAPPSITLLTNTAGEQSPHTMGGSAATASPTAAGRQQQLAALHFNPAGHSQQQNPRVQAPAGPNPLPLSSALLQQQLRQQSLAAEASYCAPNASGPGSFVTQMPTHVMAAASEQWRQVGQQGPHEQQQPGTVTVCLPDGQFAVAVMQDVGGVPTCSLLTAPLAADMALTQEGSAGACVVQHAAVSAMHAVDVPPASPTAQGQTPRAQVQVAGKQACGQSMAVSSPALQQLPPPQQLVTAVPLLTQPLGSGPQACTAMDAMQLDTAEPVGRASQAAPQVQEQQISAATQQQQQQQLPAVTMAAGSAAAQVQVGLDQSKEGFSLRPVDGPSPKGSEAILKRLDALQCADQQHPPAQSKLQGASSKLEGSHHQLTSTSVDGTAVAASMQRHTSGTSSATTTAGEPQGSHADRNHTSEMMSEAEQQPKAVHDLPSINGTPAMAMTATAAPAAATAGLLAAAATRASSLQGNATLPAIVTTTLSGSFSGAAATKANGSSTPTATASLPSPSMRRATQKEREGRSQPSAGMNSSSSVPARNVCNIDNCYADLTGLKDYHQRFRICDYHLKLSCILRDGHPQRFCQQCGRFHHLSEFDGNKRSCRTRLQQHNMRRRKRLEGEKGTDEGTTVDLPNGRGNRGLQRQLPATYHTNIVLDSPFTGPQQPYLQGPVKRTKTDPGATTASPALDVTSVMDGMKSPRNAGGSAAAPSGTSPVMYVTALPTDTPPMATVNGAAAAGPMGVSVGTPQWVVLPNTSTASQGPHTYMPVQASSQHMGSQPNTPSQNGHNGMLLAWSGAAPTQLPVASYATSVHGVNLTSAGGSGVPMSMQTSAGGAPLIMMIEPSPTGMAAISGAAGL